MKNRVSLSLSVRQYRMFYVMLHSDLQERNLLESDHEIPNRLLPSQMNTSDDDFKDVKLLDEMAEKSKEFVGE